MRLGRGQQRWAWLLYFDAFEIKRGLSVGLREEENLWAWLIGQVKEEGKKKKEKKKLTIMKKKNGLGMESI